MSYDGWIVLQLADDDAHELAELGNYTSNVSGMWAHALTEAMPPGTPPLRLSDTEGWTCAAAAPILARAVEVMERDEAALRAFEPANGWGDYEGALKYLGRVARQCQRFAGVAGASLHWWV